MSKVVAIVAAGVIGVWVGHDVLTKDDSSTPRGISGDRSSCDSNYSGCVRDVGYDLDCADIGHSVRVLGSDPNRFDADGDGWGCESYG